MQSGVHVIQSYRKQTSPSVLLRASRVTVRAPGRPQRHEEHSAELKGETPGKKRHHH